MTRHQRLEVTRSMARDASRPHDAGGCPRHLSPETWRFLGHHVGRAFTRPGAWRPTLRRAVRRATAEMQALGAEPAVVRQVLERSVLEHSACARYDRMLLVTRQRYSHGVVAAMHAWVEVDQPASSTTL